MPELKIYNNNPRKYLQKPPPLFGESQPYSIKHLNLRWRFGNENILVYAHELGSPKSGIPNNCVEMLF